MKRNAFGLIALLLSVLAANAVFAGVPLNNLEGVGGIAFNPLAYPANSRSKFWGAKDESKSETSNDKREGLDVPQLLGVLSRPSTGAWYVRLSDVNVDWLVLGTAETFFKRLEVSYGWEGVWQKDAPAIYKNNIGTKLLLLPENSFGTKFLPAVSAGFILKNTNHVPGDADHIGWDGYLVATKLIKELPLPVLVSGGLLTTNSRATGVFGYDGHRRYPFFWNVDVLPLKNMAIGFEYKFGAKYPNWKDADYFDVHAAWMINGKLTLVAAWVNAGDEKRSDRIGLGDGFTVSLHYSF